MIRVTIGFSAPAHWNPLSAAIMAFEGLKFSHCYFRYFSADYGQEMVVHSKLFNVHTMPFSKFEKGAKIVYEASVMIPELNFKAGMKLTGKDMGKGYGYLQLFGFFAMRLFGGKNPIKDNGVICSECLWKFMVGALLTGRGGLDYNSIGLKKVYVETKSLAALEGLDALTVF